MFVYVFYHLFSFTILFVNFKINYSYWWFMWLLQNEKGTVGHPGPQGFPGTTGRDGIPGNRGEKGELGSIGDREDKGEQVIFTISF